MTVCSRCGVVNRSGRVACIQCLFRLDPAADAGSLMCADHPQAPATGRCVTCQKLVCDTCGGVINNRAVYCIDHAALAMTGGLPGAQPKARKRGKAA